MKLQVVNAIQNPYYKANYKSPYFFIVYFI
jgi:hypothetical protein